MAAAAAAAAAAEAVARIREVLPDIEEGFARKWCETELGKDGEDVESFVLKCLEEGDYPRTPAPPAPRRKSALEEAEAFDVQHELEQRWWQELAGEQPPDDGQQDAAAAAAAAIGGGAAAAAVAAGANYNLHAVHALSVRFPKVPLPNVRKAFMKHGAFAATLRDLESYDGKELVKGRLAQLPVPPCEVPRELVREIALASQSGDIIASELARRRADRKRVIAKLKRIGGLNTCGCCFDDELTEEQTIYCSASTAHTFCISCVKNTALAFFGTGLFAQNLYEGSSGHGAGAGASSSSSSSSAGPRGAPSEDAARRRAKVALATVCCPHTSGCTGSFSDAALRRALPARDFKRYTSRSAALHAVASGIQGLAPCPACDYMVEMSGGGEGVIRCLDPDCGKVSCRWCGEDDHRPLRCYEVEKDSEAKLRTFIEEKMTEEVARRCPNPKCRKAYEKIEGCNKITCPCGTTSCYLCGAIVDSKRPYDHFRDGNLGGGTADKSSRCTVYGVPAWAKRSSAAVKRKAEAALEEYLEAHPELRGLEGERLARVRRNVGLEEAAPPPRKKSKQERVGGNDPSAPAAAAPPPPFVPLGPPPGLRDLWGFLRGFARATGGA